MTNGTMHLMQIHTKWQLSAVYKQS